MKKVLAPEVEKGRTGGGSGCGPYGSFSLLDLVSGRRFVVVASDGRDWNMEGLPGPPWEHVSVSREWGCPTWAEMCWIKDLFFEPDEWVVQYHPAKSDYVNTHPNCLHLWRPPGEFPKPPKECV